MPRALTAEEIWARVDKSGGPDACWPWRGGTHNPRGYGIASYQRKNHLAHRLAWSLTNGPIPDGLFALHRCDNPPCVNPAHLFLGTHADNAADREAKGRGGERLRIGDKNGSRLHPERLVRGEGHPRARLSDDTVRAIRSAKASGLSHSRIAKDFGVGRSTVHSVVQRHVWKHVEG